MITIPSRLSALLSAEDVGRLTDRVLTIARDWELKLEEPFEPGGYTAWVAKAHDKDGNSCVLKVQAVLGEGQVEFLDRVQFEATALKAWGAMGAVRLFKYETDSLLLEYLPPSETLNDVSDDVSDQVTHQLLPTLWKTQISSEIPRISTLLAFRQEQLMAFAKGHDSDTICQTWEYLKTRWSDLLTLAQDESYLLHGDLHGENFRKNSAGQWIILDPSPLIGPCSYDLEPLGRKYLDRNDLLSWQLWAAQWEQEGVLGMLDYALGRSLFHAWQTHYNQDLPRLALWEARLLELNKLIP